MASMASVEGKQALRGKGLSAKRFWACQVAPSGGNGRERERERATERGWGLPIPLAPEQSKAKREVGTACLPCP